MQPHVPSYVWSAPSKIPGKEVAEHASVEGKDSDTRLLTG